MDCILKSECNFLHGYFRCLLPLETVDVEVKVKLMRRIHTSRRDRTTPVILCNPQSTRLCPYSSLIRQMKTYLQLEGKLGPKPRPQPLLQPCTSTPSHNKFLNKKNSSAQEGRKENESQSNSKEKVQSKGNHPAFAYHPKHQLCP